AVHDVILGRLAEPYLLEDEQQREQTADRDRHVDHAGRQRRELGDGVAPGDHAQVHAVAEHEPGDQQHAGVHSPFHRRAAARSDRLHQRLDRDLLVGAVHGGAADEGEEHHHDHRGRLGPLQRVVHHVAHEHAGGNNQRDRHHGEAGKYDAAEVQALHQPAVGIPHGKKRAASALTSAARFRAGRYLVSRIRWISAAYLAPYLSRTGWVALKKASLSAGTNLTPAAFSLPVASVTYASHSWRCSSCASRESFLIRSWSALGSLSQLAFE